MQLPPFEMTQQAFQPRRSVRRASKMEQDSVFLADQEQQDMPPSSSDTSCPIADLPADCLAHIFFHVNLIHLFKLMRVSRAFNKIARHVLTDWDSLEITYSHEVSQRQRDALFADVRDNGSLLSAVARSLSPMRRLQRFACPSPDVEKAWVPMILANSRSLRSLDVFRLPEHPSLRFPSLVSLRVDCSLNPEIHLDLLSHSPCLSRLKLRGRVTEAIIKSIVNPSLMQELDISIDVAADRSRA